MCSHMPWRPHFTEDEARSALTGAESWREVLEALGYRYHGKNIETVRKWAARWDIPTSHLTDQRAPRRARYTEAQLREAVAASLSWAETLRRLGYCPTGGNWRTLKRRVTALGISTAHFDPYAASRGPRNGRMIPLEDVLVVNSTYNRTGLKKRLYESGLRERKCELCGQGEIWRGKRIGLILDHINGVWNDNRLENLRIVCPNCAAGLDTHCGRRNRIEAAPRRCARCKSEFRPKYPQQRYCSAECGRRGDRRGRKRPGARRAVRPALEQLLKEIDELGYLAVGRRYGVSDNAIRKWVRDYERERAIAEGRDPHAIEIPRRTWPNARPNRKAA